MTTMPTESRHPTRRLPAGATSAACQACGARTSKLSLYRTPAGLACRTCVASAR
jgi:hypothetical protein